MKNGETNDPLINRHSDWTATFSSEACWSLTYHPGFSSHVCLPNCICKYATSTQQQQSTHGFYNLDHQKNFGDYSDLRNGGPLRIQSIPTNPNKKKTKQTQFRIPVAKKNHQKHGKNQNNFSDFLRIERYPIITSHHFTNPNNPPTTPKTCPHKIMRLQLLEHEVH